MNNTQDQNKSVRPSLYGSSASTSTYSVLGALTPMSRSKHHVVLASVASFIVGGVMGGGVVGMVQQSEPLPAVSAIGLSSSNMQAIQQPRQQTSQQSTQNTVVASALPMPSVIQASQPMPSEVTTIKPLGNPLDSFKNNSDQEISDQDRFNKKIQAPKITTPSHQSQIAAPRDDLAMQKLIENKSMSIHVHEKNNEQKRRIEKDYLRKESLEKEKIEAAFKAELPIKNIHMDKEANPSKLTIKPKKDNARDKDVLLVKSMLDTMDHPAAKTKNAQTTTNTRVELKN